jgi:hypothetical protein
VTTESRRAPALGNYLQPGGAAQRRVLALMADGHGRYLRQSRPESRCQALDLDRMRARSAAPAAHRIVSALRDATGRSGIAR